MIIRADTNNPGNVPALGETFKVARVEKNGSWWLVELEKEETR